MHVLREGEKLVNGHRSRPLLFASDTLSSLSGAENMPVHAADAWISDKNKALTDPVDSAVLLR